MTPPAIPARPLLRHALLAAGLGLLVTLPFLGAPLISREQELRVVLTARDMARGADWLVPRYLGEPRLNKPPLQYWTTALAFRVAGTTQSPAVARLPAALQGALLLGFIAALGAVLVGKRRALLAAVIAATTVLFWRFSRLAETDIPQSCFEAAATLCLFHALRQPRSLRWWSMAGLLAGVGFMIKGPAALILPAAAAVTCRMATPRQDRSRIPPSRIGLALLLFAAVAAPWYAYVLFGHEGRAAASDVTSEINALGAGTKHAAPLAFYLYTLPPLLLPWGLLLPWALAAAWRLRRHDGIRMLLAWFGSSLAVMSVVPSKQAHYSTLLLAPSALLLALWLARRRAMRRGVLKVLPVVTILVFWAMGAIFHEFSEPARIVRDTAAKIALHGAPGVRVFAAGRRVNSLRFYLDRPLQPAASFDEALANASPGDLIVLAADRRNPVLPAAPPFPPLLSSRQGPVAMQVYRKP